jgi:hypothetical protein
MGGGHSMSDEWQKTMLHKQFHHGGTNAGALSDFWLHRSASAALNLDGAMCRKAGNVR